MALIKCPECGKEVSDKASSCIHCGCPFNMLEVQQNNTYYQHEDLNDDAILEYPVKKSRNKKALIISIFIVIIAGVSGLSLYYYFITRPNLMATKKMWRDYASMEGLDNYRYDAIAVFDNVQFTININKSYDLSNSEIFRHLYELNERCSEKQFDIDYKFIYNDTDYWIEDDLLCTGNGEKINIADDICYLLSSGYYSDVISGLYFLPKEYFDTYKEQITEKYIELVRSNKVSVKFAENNKGCYLGLKTKEFEMWAKLGEIGNALEQLGAYNVNNCIIYAAGVQDLKKYSEYDKILEYSNSLRFEIFFDDIFNHDGLTQQNIISIKNSFDNYDFSGLVSGFDKHCMKLYNCLIKYDRGLTDFYNGTWAGYGSKVADKGSETLISASEELKGLLFEWSEIQIKMINDIGSLPKI